MTEAKRILVLGATGFIGRATVAGLRNLGHQAMPFKAPRLPPLSGDAAQRYIGETCLTAELRGIFEDYDAVINAAGNPDTTAREAGHVTAANGILPGLLSAAVSACPNNPRFVHVSSAAVQGRVPELNDGPPGAGFSLYSRSKVLGERLVIESRARNCVIYRPPSVHAVDRRVTRMISALGGSPLSTVASPRSSPTPQALVPNVGSAIAFLATTDETPPAIVTHPSEGLTTSHLLEVLGGRVPREIPQALARGLVAALFAGSKGAPSIAVNARRLEMLWFGQRQAVSWLATAGWSPPAGHDAWIELGRQLKDRRERQHG